jgi:hypothetical protein
MCTQIFPLSRSSEESAQHPSYRYYDEFSNVKGLIGVAGILAFQRYIKQLPETEKYASKA